jgi:hypothetical protein
MHGPPGEVLGSRYTMPGNSTRWLLPTFAVITLSSCSGGSGSVPDAALPDPADSAGLGFEAGGIEAGAVDTTAPDGGAVRTLSGLVTDQAGVPVVGVKLVSGTASVLTDGQGLYTLGPLPAGPGVVSLNRDWFQPMQITVDLPDSGDTHRDITITEIPLKLDPADVALAALYNQTFDWTKQALSISIAATPTRRNFDNAVYRHNPALYRDTSQQAPVVPSPLPDIVAGVAQNMSFPIRGGTSDGKQALDLTSAVDAVASTPVAATAETDYMLWTPMINWLTDWDPAKAATLKTVGAAVRAQNWGSNAVRPQDIERVFVDATNTTMWVEVLFAKFVTVGPGINDDDGDGYREIYVKVDAPNLSQEILDKLVSYRQIQYTTHGLSKETTKALREIYSSTSAQVERLIGQPFEIPGVGIINYPFVVLRHAGGQENVILVGPAN